MKKHFVTTAYIFVSLVLMIAMGKALFTVSTLLPSTAKENATSFSEVLRHSTQPTAQIIDEEKKEESLHGSAPDLSGSGELFPDAHPVRPDTEERLREKGYK